MINKKRGISAVNGALDGLDLRKYDAIVVTLGATDAFALIRPERWAEKMMGLLNRILDASAPSTVVVIAGVHPATAPGQHGHIRSRVDEHARMLNRITQRICGQIDRTSFVPLHSSTQLLEPRRTSDIYLAWAQHIAGCLAPSLSAVASQPDNASNAPRELRIQPQPVAERQRSLADLGIAETGPEWRFDRVVALARAYFDTQFAAFVLSDGHRVSYKSRSGFRGTPRIAKLVSATIDTAVPLAIANARTDQRYKPSILATCADVGFYLGYPIESPAGYRVGVLCVFDQTPRVTRTADNIMLRDLAMTLQRELWSQAEVVENV
ncbi:GAF domain-containing protein [Homoserinimonas sp. A520]